jgi:hypothetical protein
MMAVFLSPLVSKALRRTKAGSLKASSGTASSTPSRYGLIGHKAYDSDPLDCDLAERYSVEMIAPLIAKFARARRRTVVFCAVTANVGESRDFSLGSITFVGW